MVPSQLNSRLGFINPGLTLPDHVCTIAYTLWHSESPPIVQVNHLPIDPWTMGL